MRNSKPVFCRLLGHKLSKKGIILVEKVDGGTEVQERKVVNECERRWCDHVRELDEPWGPPFGGAD